MPTARSWSFDCSDCGAQVTWFTEPPSLRCAACLWLADTTFASPAEKTELRDYMLARGIIGPSDNGESFTCPTCGAVSWHPQDVAMHYCGMCHKFIDDMSRETNERERAG